MNHLQLNISKTKEIVVEFRRRKSIPSNVDILRSYKYLGVMLDKKLDETTNTEAVYRRGMSRLYFLQRLKSFGVCKKMLHILHQSVVVRTIFYAVVCWGADIKTKKKDANGLNKLIKKCGSVVGVRLAPLEAVAV